MPAHVLPGAPQRRDRPTHHHQHAGSHRVAQDHLPVHQGWCLQPAWMTAYMPAYLPACLPARPPTCLPPCLPPCLPASLPACLPAHLPSYLAAVAAAADHNYIDMMMILFR